MEKNTIVTVQIGSMPYGVYLAFMRISHLTGGMSTEQQVNYWTILAEAAEQTHYEDLDRAIGVVVARRSYRNDPSSFLAD